MNTEYAKAELRYFYDFTCMIMYIFWAIWRNLWFHVKEIAKAVCILFAANLLTREYYPKRWIILYICKHMRIDAYHLLKIQGIKVLVCTSISPFIVLSHCPESAKLSHCINRLWHSKFIKSSKNGNFFPIWSHT